MSSWVLSRLRTPCEIGIKPTPHVTASASQLSRTAGGATTATIESKTNLFRAGRQGTVHVVSRPLHVGRTNIVVQTDLFDADERRISQTTQTQAVLQPR